MNQYHTFIGIDIGKNNFVVAIHDKKGTHEYANTPEGIALFLEAYHPHFKDGLCILETTGGYETSLLYTLCSKKIAVHRADTRKVKSFIRSYGNKAKTDILDAKALARYGKERMAHIGLFEPQSQRSRDLFALTQRRSDLKKLLVAEKNRLQSPACTTIRPSVERMLAVIQSELAIVTEQIQTLINSDATLKAKQETIRTVAGIGEITSMTLLVFLPELGSLDSKKIASLAGLAPRANESGQFKGYRRIAPGRQGIKSCLFMAAMAARNSNSNLKAFYEKLIAKGKKKMVALTALMRKILVIANARLKDPKNHLLQTLQHA
jgi:transposase